jgi:hypothetical protein
MQGTPKLTAFFPELYSTSGKALSRGKCNDGNWYQWSNDKIYEQVSRRSKQFYLLIAFQESEAVTNITDFQISSLVVGNSVKCDNSANSANVPEYLARDDCYLASAKSSPCQQGSNGLSHGDRFVCDPDIGRRTSLHFENMGYPVHSRG